MTHYYDKLAKRLARTGEVDVEDLGAAGRAEFHAYLHRVGIAHVYTIRQYDGYGRRVFMRPYRPGDACR